jgi:hypothetical protein
MHDGGDSVDIYQNDQLICHSVATYAAGAPQMGEMSGMTGSGYNAKLQNIAGISSCNVNTPIKKGDTVRLVVNYDFLKHPG